MFTGKNDYCQIIFFGLFSLGFFWTLYFVLRSSQLTVFRQIQVNREGSQPDIYMYPPHLFFLNFIYLFGHAGSPCFAWGRLEHVGCSLHRNGTQAPCLGSTREGSPPHFVTSVFQSVIPYYFSKWTLHAVSSFSSGGKLLVVFWFGPH